MPLVNKNALLTFGRMKHKLHILPFILLALTGLFLLQSCDDDETYADKRKREDKQIRNFLNTGAKVEANDGGGYLLDIPGNIRVISEREFNLNDSTTDVTKNEYVFFSRTGVYMQIVDKGTGPKIEDGEQVNIITRYTEFNIATDSIQSTNKHTAATEMTPDIMLCSNNSGTYTGTFLKGVMHDTYNSAAVPAGWLVPLTYIGIGKLDSPTASLAKVRIIVPSSQGHANANSNVYPCFYEITYQRGR